MNVSSVAEFQRQLVLKRKNQHAQRKPLYFLNTMNDSSSKIGHDNLENKVPQQRNLTLKVRIWHYLRNFHSLCSQNTIIFFEFVDSGPQILLFRTHHLWNFTTELTLQCTCIFFQYPSSVSCSDKSGWLHRILWIGCCQRW